MKPLWQVYHDTVKPFGFERLQYILRTRYSIDKSQSQIYRYGEDPATTGTPLPAEMYVPVTLVIGDPSILRYYTEAAGYMIIKLPECRNLSTKNITREIAKTLKECAEAVEVSSRAIMDGKLTADEKARIEREINQAQAQLARLSEVIKNG